ncbi:MAG: endonuclease III [Actinomycetota bacterium]
MVQPKKEARAPWAGRETDPERTKRARAVLRLLRKEYPGAKTALVHRSPFELLVATVLSAQSTDRTVNEITPGLFAKYSGPRAFLASAPGELEQDIHRSGFFNQKAKSIRGLCRGLLDEFDGEVPRTMAELTRLPGVARKTANVVLSNAFGINDGIAVDTHVHRLSWRLALSDADDPVKVERDLMAMFPRARWADVTHVLIEHGRAVCGARAPRCEDCVVNAKCPSSRAPGAAV